MSIVLNNRRGYCSRHLSLKGQPKPLMAPVRPPQQSNNPEQEAKMEAANLLVSLSNTTASKSVFVPITAQPQQLIMTSNRDELTLRTRNKNPFYMPYRHGYPNPDSHTGWTISFFYTLNGNFSNLGIIF